MPPNIQRKSLPLIRADLHIMNQTCRVQARVYSELGIEVNIFGTKVPALECNGNTVSPAWQQSFHRVWWETLDKIWTMEAFL
uniref:Uncharacterized protein n=1 Tax=Nelumbo nucifera TaxID=4432 RepID=A0A822Y5J3_NELNU|nr:TPA_asm: hypothetical protein HUJ06_026342 [Nelumbo nucifera]